jgi:hypothetical protein
MIATEYAKDHRIEGQREQESDQAFKSRVSGELRSRGHIIEAHEVWADSRHDGDGNAMTGIMGAVAMMLENRDYGQEGESLVGCEWAAGEIVKHNMSPAGRKEDEQKKATLALIRAGIDPFECT